jgi:hypothetical protein
MDKKGGDHLPMDYFDNFDNKFKINFKIEKPLWICYSIYRLMLIQIYTILLSFDTP